MSGGIPDSVRQKALADAAAGGIGTTVDVTVTDQPDDTVTLLVNKQAMTGWTDVRITRSLDRVPSDFDISLTERNPDTAQLMSIQAGMSCQLKLGADPVITGWVDRVVLSFSTHSHTVRIMGRSLCEDLTDCSVTPDVITGMQVFSSSLEDLATKLATPFKIKVVIGPGVNTTYSPGANLSQINAVLTETPWEIIERVARAVGVLLYDLPDGSLILANVGTSTMATGFQQGLNVQGASVSYAVDERYSIYLPTLMSTIPLGQVGLGGQGFEPVKDNFSGAVTRFRPLIIVSEQFMAPNVAMAEKRAQWEAARRYGRSQAVQLSCDSWRDKDGTLWAPNAFAPIHLPALKLTPSDPWVIGSVTYTKDADRGTGAEIVMMPKEAFQPSPLLLVPFLNVPTVKPPTTSSGSTRTQSNDGPGA